MGSPIKPVFFEGTREEILESCKKVFSDVMGNARGRNIAKPSDTEVLIAISQFICCYWGDPVGWES